MSSMLKIVEDVEVYFLRVVMSLVEIQPTSQTN